MNTLRPNALSLPAPRPAHALLRDQPRLPFGGVQFPRGFLTGSTTFGCGGLLDIPALPTIARAPRQNPTQREKAHPSPTRDAKAMLARITAAHPAMALAEMRRVGSNAAQDPKHRETAAPAETIAVQDPIQREKLYRLAVASPAETPDHAATDGRVEPGHDVLYGDTAATTPMGKVAAEDPIQREKVPGPLRNGNPRGNPNLAPRCGAKTRVGCPCKSPAMGNGRCRMHGGASTGPKTAEGKARISAARRASVPPAIRAMTERTTMILRQGQVLRAIAKAGLETAAVVPLIRTVRGDNAPSPDTPLFAAVWDGLTQPPLTAGETRALVAAIRDFAGKDPMHRAPVGSVPDPRYGAKSPVGAVPSGLSWSGQARP